MIKRKVLDHGYIELVETWGSDRMIVDHARERARYAPKKAA